MTTNLFELKDALWELVTQAPETDEELEGWQELALAELEGEFDEKIDSCTAMVRHLEGEAKFVKEEAARMSARAKGITGRAQRLKEYMCKMIMARPKVLKKGVEKYETVKTARFTVWPQQSPLSIDRELVNIEKADESGYVSWEPSIRISTVIAKIKGEGEIPAGFEKAVKEGKWTLRIR